MALASIRRGDPTLTPSASAAMAQQPGHWHGQGQGQGQWPGTPRRLTGVEWNGKCSVTEAKTKMEPGVELRDTDVCGSTNRRVDTAIGILKKYLGTYIHMYIVTDRLLYPKTPCPGSFVSLIPLARPRLCSLARPQRRCIRSLLLSAMYALNLSSRRHCSSSSVSLCRLWELDRRQRSLAASSLKTTYLSQPEVLRLTSSDEDRELDILASHSAQ
jgi:hypothetical protein